MLTAKAVLDTKDYRVYYEVQAVEWRIARDPDVADFREVVRQSDVIKVQVQNDVDSGGV